MKGSIRTLLVALAAIITLVCVPIPRAEDTTVIPNPVTGKIEKADRYSSTIVIRYGEGEGDLVTIVGFPFHNLEAQLDEVWDYLDPDADGIKIAAGDCVTVEYTVNELCSKATCSEDVVYKWESLTAYCEACSTCEDCIIKAGEDGNCYVSSELTRLPQQNNRPKP